MKQELHSRAAGESRLDVAYRINALRCTKARDAERPKLMLLRDAAALSEAGRSSSTMQAVEWGRLHTMSRVVFLLTAGIDGENEALATKSWGEFNPVEKAAIQVAMRGLRASLIGAQALCRS